MLALGRSTALNPAAPPAAAPRIGRLNRVVGRGGTTFACSAVGREFLVQQQRFGHGRRVKFKQCNSD